VDVLINHREESEIRLSAGNSFCCKVGVQRFDFGGIFRMNVLWIGPAGCFRCGAQQALMFRVLIYAALVLKNGNAGQRIFHQAAKTCFALLQFFFGHLRDGTMPPVRSGKLQLDENYLENGFAKGRV
jgi:hypothetical protein